MTTEALNAVSVAVCKVMNLPADVIDESTAFRAINADSVALIVIADVIEERFPQFVVNNDLLKAARTVGELAAGLELKL